MNKNTKKWMEKKKQKIFTFYFVFLDSGNLLAFGYRLPEKSYAIFRLPPPGILFTKAMHSVKSYGSSAKTP